MGKRTSLGRPQIESQLSSSSDQSQVLPPETSETSVVRRWRVAGIKLRVGLGQFKHRDTRNMDTFISRESEVYIEKVFHLHLVENPAYRIKTVGHILRIPCNVK